MEAKKHMSKSPIEEQNIEQPKQDTASWWSDFVATRLGEPMHQAGDFAHEAAKVEQTNLAKAKAEQKQNTALTNAEKPVNMGGVKLDESKLDFGDADEMYTNLNETTTTNETPATDKTTATNPVVQMYEKIAQGQKDAAEQAKTRSEEYNELMRGQLSAYQALVKDSLKRKEELAQKKERNARSQAIANALGSLVNVFTANAMAKKGGYAPIVADYDKTYDNALRQSIEQRYALGNESENLLVGLEKERLKLQSDIAGKAYAQDIATINAAQKVNADLAKAIAEEERWKDRIDYRVNKEVEAAKQKAEDKGSVQKDVHQYKADNPIPSQAPKKKEEPKPFKYDFDKLNQFVLNATEITTIDDSDPRYVAKNPDGTPKRDANGNLIRHKIIKKSAEKGSTAYKAATRIGKKLQENGVSDDYQTKIQSVLRTLLGDENYKSYITEQLGEDLTKGIVEEIKKANSEKKELSADYLTAVAKAIIDAKKTITK